MREFAITPKTLLSLLITGLRMRSHRTPQQLGAKLGINPALITGWESDSEAAANIPVGLFIELMGELGAHLIAQAPTLGEGPQAMRDLVNDEPDEPVEPADESVVDGRPAPRTVYVMNAGDLAHPLRMAAARTGRSVKALSEGMGLDPSVLSRHQNQGGNLTLEVLARYADFFNINIVVGRRP